MKAKPAVSVRRVHAPPDDPEGALFRAYGSVQPGQPGVFRVTDRRDEPCACGGVLSISGAEVVEKVVENHNESALHEAYRAWRAEHDA